MKNDPFRDGPLRQALCDLFNGKNDATEETLRQYLAADPLDPLAHSFRAASLFYAFAAPRMGLRHGRLMWAALSGGIGLPEDIGKLRAALQEARRLATLDLEEDARDENALLALCTAEGVERDLLVLGCGRPLAALQCARASTFYARRLLQVNPCAYDAYYIIGFSEYALASVPAALRSIARIPGIIGQTGRAVQFLQAAAREGWYLRDLARQVLVGVYLWDDKPHDAARVLEGLVRDFRGNPVYSAALEELAMQKPGFQESIS